MSSLSRRLLLAVSMPLMLFFGLTIAVLDASFRTLAERSLHELLNAQMLALIAAADLETGGALTLARPAAESRLDTPGSGLYAEVRGADGRSLWRSPSAAGTFLDFGPAPRSSVTQFLRRPLPDGSTVEIASRMISWEGDSGGARPYVFSVAASRSPYEEQLWSFRRRLFGWFTGLTALLLATLATLLRWTLAPVRRLEREIDDVEAGRRTALGAAWPRELEGVATNLNALLDGERRRVQRYRDTLGNLAHSLKTPLAVMRAGIGSGETRDLQAQIDSMSAIVEHQLKRAAAGGGAIIGHTPVEIAAAAQEVRAALLKVYRTKDLALELAVDPGASFRGDRGDLLELLGNLLDNACKWAAGTVRLTASQTPAGQARRELRIIVDDDGPGISSEDRARVLKRGARADEKAPGHGLGLAMVRDTIELYGGTMAIETSPLGGARVVLQLPGR